MPLRRQGPQTLDEIGTHPSPNLLVLWPQRQQSVSPPAYGINGVA
jgi:hypothetical protein